MVLNVCFVGKSFSCRSFCTGVFDMTLGWSLVTFIHAYESPGNGSKVFGAIGTSFSEDTWAHEAVGQGGSLEQNKAIRRKPKKDAYRSPHKRTGSTVICNVSKRYTVDCRCCCFPVFQPHESWNYIYISFHIFPSRFAGPCAQTCFLSYWDHANGQLFSTHGTQSRRGRLLLFHEMGETSRALVTKTWMIRGAAEKVPHFFQCHLPSTSARSCHHTSNEIQKSSHCMKA